MADKHPLVFGMRPLWPGQLARVEMHQTRTGGDLSHIRPGRTHLNSFLVGNEDWRGRLEEELRRASELNYRHAYSARRWIRKRKKEAAEIRRAGPQDPWKRDRSEGPLREGVLTANRKYFEGDTPGFPSVEKENQFRRAALRFLTEQFGNSCVAAWEDRDEEAYHIHFVIAPWTLSESKQAGKQRTLVPSSILVIKSYEAGHDIAAEYFKNVGLVRGEKRAQRRREAFHNEGKSEFPAENATCHEWRAEEAVRLDEKRWKAAEAWRCVKARSDAAAKRAAAAEAAEKRSLELAANRQKGYFEQLEKIERREAAAVAKEADLKRRESELVGMLLSFAELGDAVKNAARKIGLTDNPLVKTAIDAVEKMRVMVGKLDGRQRVR